MLKQDRRAELKLGDLNDKIDKIETLLRNQNDGLLPELPKSVNDQIQEFLQQSAQPAGKISNRKGACTKPQVAADFGNQVAKETNGLGNLTRKLAHYSTK